MTLNRHLMDLKSNGVAWGTLIAQYSGLLISIWLFKKYYGRYLKHFQRSAMFELDALKKFFVVNKDILIRTLALIFAMSFFTTKSAETNDTILAVNTLLFQFFIFFSYFVDGFANAGKALAGRFIGADNKPDLKKVIRLIFIWGLGVSLCFTMVYGFGGSFLVGLMTSHEDVLALAQSYLFWVAIIPFISFAAFLWEGIYIGATVSNHLRNSILFSLVFFLLIYYSTTSAFGNHGLWLSLTVFLAMRGIYLSLFARRSIFSLT